MDSKDMPKDMIVRKMVPGSTVVCRILSQWPTKGWLKNLKPAKKHLMKEIIRRDPRATPKFWSAQLMVDKLFQLPLAGQDGNSSDDGSVRRTCLKEDTVSRIMKNLVKILCSPPLPLFGHRKRNRPGSTGT
jgi:hypothetical protein